MTDITEPRYTLICAVGLSARLLGAAGRGLLR
jgi:hypothetical protein